MFTYKVDFREYNSKEMNYYASDYILIFAWSLKQAKRKQKRSVKRFNKDYPQFVVITGIKRVKNV